MNRYFLHICFKVMPFVCNHAARAEVRHTPEYNSNTDIDTNTGLSSSYWLRPIDSVETVFKMNIY